ncbi:MAG: hypothetical protein AB1830_13085 [Pseudomonadota bacterium]
MGGIGQALVAGWWAAAGPVKLDGLSRVVGHLRRGPEDLGEALLRAGHARIYRASRREGWC